MFPPGACDGGWPSGGLPLAGERPAPSPRIAAPNKLRRRVGAASAVPGLTSARKLAPLKDVESGGLRAAGGDRLRLDPLRETASTGAVLSDTKRCVLSAGRVSAPSSLAAKGASFVRRIKDVEITGAVSRNLDDAATLLDELF